VQDGVAGIRDVALSLPSIVDAGGAARVVTPDLNEAERAALEHSAEVLARAAASIE
jgi:L-lactate dehydrogenase